VIGTNKNPFIIMKKHVECPMDPSKTFTSMKWNLKEVKKIEYHVKTSRCHHPPLQDLVVTGAYGNERSTPLLMACQHGDLKAVQRIVERWGIDVRSAAVHCCIDWPYTRVIGVTPLFVAAFFHHRKIVEYLVGKGANVNSRTRAANPKHSGMTPLYAASIIHSDEALEEEKILIIHFLLESGADPSPITDDGRPIWFNSSLCSQITTLLVEWGMSVKQRAPNSGITVLRFWAKKATDVHEDGSLRVVQMLLEKGADI